MIFSVHILRFGGYASLRTFRAAHCALNTTINAQYYTKCIPQQVLLPVFARKKKSGSATKHKMFNSRLQIVFMQDGAPVQTARMTQRLCYEKLLGFLCKEEWPPNSPDLNPIENCWLILNSLVFSSLSPTIIKKLSSRALREWGKI